MTPEEKNIAEDFERGWSADRLAAVELTWGPGLNAVIPPGLAAQVTRYARREGVTELAVIRAALAAYLADHPAD